jgi:hypothetical protein
MVLRVSRMLGIVFPPVALSQLLGSLFTPCSSKASNGKRRISNPRMAQLLAELVDEIGVGVFP